MVLLAGFQALLFRYSGQEEILVGSPIAGRTRKETQGLIGFFVNTLVMRSRFTNGITFRQLLHSVKDTTLEAYAHQDLPFEKLVEELSPERNLGRSPFFQAMFVFQNAPMPELQLGSAILRLIDIESETAKFEITLTLFDSQDELQGTIEYSTELFDPDTIARFADQFTFLLDSLLTEPDHSVPSVPFVSDREMIRLRLGWAGPPTSDKADTNVPGLVREHASDEAKVAIVSKGQAFTYAELNRRAGELSGRLQALGIERGIRVGICVNDGVEAVVALLGVLKAGAVAVPLNADDPVARMEYIVKDAGVAWVVSDAKCNERVLQAGVQAILVDGPENQLHVNQTVNKQSEIDCHVDALLLYQSDPSGKPKGVGVPHNALLPRPFAGEAAILETDRIGQRVRLGSLDNETPELLRFLALGATIIDLSGEKTPRKLATTLRDQAVSVLLPRAAELERLATEFSWSLKTVRMIVLCEDRGIALEHLRHNLNSDLLDRTYQAYGSNETGGWWALHPMDDKDEGLTAHLAAGVTLQLLDVHGKPVPEHIVGELYIGGNNIARGDHSKSEDKSSAVSANHSRNASHASRGRSGEFGWRRVDGSLQLSGRHDGRGWISGIRVETEEIEIVLKDYAGIQDAAVLAGDDTVRAFVVVSEGEEIDSVAVQTWLGKRFPPVMIPQRIDRTEQVPRLTDGTVDRKAVKALADHLDESNAAAAAYAPPRNEIEQKLAAIWQKTLGLERVGIHDDFFRIGGHSLLATQMVARISDELGATVPLRQLFETPTIAQLGSIVGSSSDSGETLAPIRRVARVPVGQHNLVK
jgi:non-ribosomal peptide synthetase component F/acyl carrier protein